MEAYKVGITIALTNKVSSALGLIRGDLKKTDAQAVALKATLKEIKMLGITGAILGGAGFLGLSALKPAYEAAKKYEQVFAQFKALNLGATVNSDADKFARGANVIGASATDLMGTVRDLHTALGDYPMAKSLGVQIAQMKYANKAVFGEHGMDFGERQLQAMEKIIEMKGGFKSPEAFLAQADMMQKVISGTGGMVKPSDYLQFIKTAGVSGRLLSNDMFYYTMEPLIQEMSGNRVGTGTMSAYNNLAQGRSTVRAATEMLRLGLLRPEDVEWTKIGTVKRIKPGRLKGMEEFTSNPYQWMKDVLIPQMAGKGITSESAILNEMGSIFGNRTGSNLFSLMYLQQEKIEKNMRISKGALGRQELFELAKKSPVGAEMALASSWENLKIAAGESLIPIVIPAINALAEGLRALGGAISRHPIRFEALIWGFTGLSAALLFSGSVLLLKAAFMGINLVFLPLASSITSTVIPAITGLTSVLAPLAAVAATIAAIYYHKDIAGKVDSAAPGVGDWLLRAQDSVAKTWGVNKNAPDTHVAVNIDGKKVATAIAKTGNGPPTSGSGFDSRQSYVPAGVTGAW